MAVDHRLSVLLPDALDRAVRNYRHLAFSEPPEDSKAFQLHQAACKAALQHIDALIKLSNSSAPSESQSENEQGDKTDALMARASAAYRAFSESSDKTEE